MIALGRTLAIRHRSAESHSRNPCRPGYRGFDEGANGNWEEKLAVPVHSFLHLMRDGRETVMMGGGSGFANGSASFVLVALPTFLRVDRTSPSADARTLMSLQAEVDHGSVGDSLVAERLVEILVVEAVRTYVATNSSDRVGWITALADPRIGKALRLIPSDAAGPCRCLRRRSVCRVRRSQTRFSARVGCPRSITISVGGWYWPSESSTQAKLWPPLPAQSAPKCIRSRLQAHHQSDPALR
jgi:hypothetical protein